MTDPVITTVVAAAGDSASEVCCGFGWKKLRSCQWLGLRRSACGALWQGSVVAWPWLAVVVGLALVALVAGGAAVAVPWQC